MHPCRVARRVVDAPSFPSLPLSNCPTEAESDDSACGEVGVLTPPEGMSEAEAGTLFRTLVQTHNTRLYRFIIKNIGNPGDAEDLAQQAFMEAVRSFQSYRGESELSTWLYGIAMNLVRNYLSRAPHRRYEFVADDELAALPDERLTPEGMLSQSQQMRALNESLAELPQSMREVLLMVAVDELSYEEAAVLLTVPVGTVRSRLSRARSALKAQMLARGAALDF